MLRKRLLFPTDQGYQLRSKEKRSSSERYHLGYPEVHQVRGEPLEVSVQGPAESQKESINRHDSKYTHSGAKWLIMSLFKILCYWLRLLRLDTQGA